MKNRKYIIVGLFLTGILVGAGLAAALFLLSSVLRKGVSPVLDVVSHFGLMLGCLTGAVGFARTFTKDRLSEKLFLILKYEALPLGICSVAIALYFV